MKIVRVIFEVAYDYAPRSVEYATAMMVVSPLIDVEMLLIRGLASFIYLYALVQALNHLRPSMRKKHGGQLRY